MTSAVKKTGSATPDASVDERQQRIRRLAAKSPDDIIAYGVRALRAAAVAKEDYEIAKAALEGHFPGEKATEHLIRESGVAERKVETSWNVIEENLPDLRQVLAAEFDLVIETKETYEVPDARMPALREVLGDREREFVVRKTSYGVTRSAQGQAKTDPAFAARIGMAIKKTVKTTIKITPVER